MQFIGLARRERTRADPGDERPIVPRPNCILVYGAGGDCCEPAPAGIVGPACARRCRWHARREPQSLDDFSVIGAPQPGAPGNERVRSNKRQGAAGERQAVGDEMGAEFRQEPIGARAIGSGIDEPRQSRRKLHRAIMGRRTILVTAYPSGWASMRSLLPNDPTRRRVRRSARPVRLTQISAAVVHDRCRDLRRWLQWRAGPRNAPSLYYGLRTAPRWE